LSRLARYFQGSFVRRDYPRSQFRSLIQPTFSLKKIYLRDKGPDRVRRNLQRAIHEIFRFRKIP